MSRSFNFNSLQENLRKAHNNPSNVKEESFFISGQEFSIGISSNKHYWCTLKSYVRCTQNKDELINDIRSYSANRVLVSYDDDEDHEVIESLFKYSQTLTFSGTSPYGFCREHKGDFNLYTVEDSSDYYIAMSFFIDQDCSLELFDIFVGFICDVLTSVFKWCNIGCCTCDSIKFVGSCDFVFIMQRLCMPNDVIKIIASLC